MLMTTQAAEELKEIVHKRIESMRPKLLDLSRRNPLISTKLNPRSNTHIRVVDELPDVLFFNLCNSQRMKIVPLPALDNDPADERSNTFKRALAEARRSDPEYLGQVEKLDKDADDYNDVLRKADRALKDRLRAQLGMSARPTKQDINLVQHARNNSISPSYDLPQTGEFPDDGRHTDDAVQTLLLPDDLERKLSALNSKCNTWLQETGLNVLHGAFGFLEWSDRSNSETSFAPLILLQVKIEKKKTRDGAEFWVSGLGEEPETNAVLLEKLRQEFSIELPAFTTGSIEEYLAEIAKLSPKGVTWRVRRQVAFGVFPSARMAMYHDLNTAGADFSTNEIIRPLLAGSGTPVASPFADEYEVDKEHVERLVPHLVMDADASQFSTLVDIANGVNLAIEGPPGSGKSQTIVNTIAAAIAAGKKVLFIAEKTAALEVVRARLDAIGLGEFLLPLQAQHSTRESVINSLRERLEMDAGRPVADLTENIRRFKETRAQIAEYVELLKLPFDETGFTIQDILGRSVATSDRLNKLPKSIQLANVPTTFAVTKITIEDAKIGATILEEAAGSLREVDVHWQGIRASHLTPFDQEAILELAKRLAAALEALRDCIRQANEFGITGREDSSTLASISQVLDSAARLSDRTQLSLIPRFANKADYDQLASFVGQCDAFQALEADILSKFHSRPDERTIAALVELEELCRKYSIDYLNVDELVRGISKKREAIAISKRLIHQMEGFAARVPGSDQWRLSDVGILRSIIDSTNPDHLYARRPEFVSDAGALASLKMLNAEGRQLREARRVLSERFSLSIAPEADEIARWLITFKTGGRFAIFSPKYRKAKAAYVGISRIKWKRVTAISDLEKLVDWKAGERDFRQNPQGPVLYGLGFKGIDTDFDLMEGVSAFCDLVRARLPLHEQNAVRAFLLHGPVQMLFEIPTLEIHSDKLTLSSLREAVARWEADTDEQENDLVLLREHTRLFTPNERPSADEIVALCTKIENYLAQEQSLGNHSRIAAALNGFYAGPKTTTAPLKPVLDLCSAIVEIPIGPKLAISIGEGLAAHAALSVQHVKEAQRACAELESDFFARTQLVETSTMVTGSLDSRAAALRAAAEDPEGLAKYVAFGGARRECRSDLHVIIDEYAAATGGYAGLAGAIEALALRSLARRVYAADRYGPVLARFLGARLDFMRSRLAQLDRVIIAATRKDLRQKLKDGARPPRGNGIGRKSQWTELALIANEVEKKKKYLSVRELTRRASAALLELKPCLMMSPLAVAQYLPKQGVTFDLCVIDEASQMPPEEAIGALARSKQAVIVGDTNQLPPSNFFRKMLDIDGDDDGDDKDDAVLNESILELANATFRPARRLRWHYRSRHSGLIKFSNRLVYNDDLVVFPSASEGVAGMGIEFRAVSGLYKAGMNPIEAREMVQAAIEFMAKDPNRSLGIVTLNQKQRDLIFEEMEIALGSNPAATKYIDYWLTHNDGLEEFFIKNLENVQGDERDVIFVGTVYGPEEPGARVMQRFGPINGTAGKRRLNVLFTRAKQQIVTFSSMSASDITAEPTGNEGAYMLKRWLEYTATGVLESGEETYKEPDSDFEIFVMNQIRAMGCTPVPQVGVKGYSIDIGVRHPQWAHGFILGVECDGATFHSSKSARDRDRLRQQVLEGLGWKFHRIWSTDWFENPRKQAEILRGVIEARLIELRAREAEFSKSTPESAENVPAAEPPIVEPCNEQESRSVIVKPGTVAVGDTVRVRYLTHGNNIVQFTISPDRSDPDNGIIHFKKPLAEALLGAEEGDEVEILVGTYVRQAVLEKIIATATSRVQ